MNEAENRLMAAFRAFVRNRRGQPLLSLASHLARAHDISPDYDAEWAEFQTTSDFEALEKQRRPTVTTICIAAQKGGAGKTTLTQCLAVEALRQGMPAAIIDTDPQLSAFKWGERRTELEIDAPAVVKLGTGSIKAVAADLEGRGAKIILIDTPPHAASAINAALEISSAAVMVTRPNPMDLESLGVTWSIVQKMKLPTATIFTQVPPQEKARALGLGQRLLDELGIMYCPTPLTYTLTYPYSQAQALAVQERDPTSKARAELAEVWAWLRRSGIM